MFYCDFSARSVFNTYIWSKNFKFNNKNFKFIMGNDVNLTKAHFLLILKVNQFTHHFSNLFNNIFSGLLFSQMMKPALAIGEG